jgi:hypothetical protein
MSGKGSTATVVTAEQVTTALQRAKVTTQEEKALRMRYGAKVDVKAPLETAYGDNEELGDELLLIEMQLLRALKARKALATKGPRNATKDKIVSKLKTKKK